MGKNKNVRSSAESPTKISTYDIEVCEHDIPKMRVELMAFPLEHPLPSALENTSLRTYFLQPPLFYELGRLASAIGMCPQVTLPTMDNVLATPWIIDWATRFSRAYIESEDAVVIQKILNWLLPKGGKVVANKEEDVEMTELGDKGAEAAIGEESVLQEVLEE
eukprot:Gb_02787 [translate_table: standard]